MHGISYYTIKTRFYHPITQAGTDPTIKVFDPKRKLVQELSKKINVTTEDVLLQQVIISSRERSVSAILNLLRAIHVEWKRLLLRAVCRHENQAGIAYSYITLEPL